MRNALTEIAWLPTTDGLLTPQQALLHAHEIGGPDLRHPGFVVSSTLRFLSAMAAVAIQEQAGGKRHLRVRELSPEAIDAAIVRIGTAADIHDPDQPFFQRPALASADSGDPRIRISTRDGSVGKLRPSVPSAPSEQFWDLSGETTTTLPIERAVLHLVVFHHFFPAGNNAYDGDKCAMGAPGLRFLGKENTATEYVWHGDSLLDTLLMSIREDWVRKGGLPAWADRTAAVSLSRDRTDATPLWRATWSSNAAACIWDGDDLVGVRVGGIPNSWTIPAMSGGKDTRKLWWDQRNLEDPFYLYLPNTQGKLQAQRLDLGRDATDLAVDWNKNGKAREVRVRSQDRLRAPGELTPLLFLRHQIFGTASSPSIRASEAFLGPAETWAPKPDAVDAVKHFAEVITTLHRAVTRPFRTPPKQRQDAAGSSHRSTAGMLRTGSGTVGGSEADASTIFWRHIEAVFHDAVAEVAQVTADDPARDAIGDRLQRNSELALELLRATGSAIDEATESMRQQSRLEVTFVRAQVRREAYYLVRDFIPSAAESSTTPDTQDVLV